MKIALIGDVHGDLQALAQVVEAARAMGADAAIQLGDLGFYEPLLGAGVSMPTFAIPVHALCGNHEDHVFLAESQKNGLIRRWAENGLIYQSRGSIVKFGGSRVGFLGGAMHIDRPQESANRTSPTEIRHAIARFSAAQPQLIVTHSCPAGIGIGMHGNDALAELLHIHVLRAGIDPGPTDDCGETGLRELWDALPVRPACWVFGHFHTFHDSRVGETRFLCCPALPDLDTLPIWDSHTGEITLHDWLDRQ